MSLVLSNIYIKKKKTQKKNSTPEIIRTNFIYTEKVHITNFYIKDDLVQ